MCAVSYLRNDLKRPEETKFQPGQHETKNNNKRFSYCFIAAQI